MAYTRPSSFHLQNILSNAHGWDSAVDAIFHTQQLYSIVLYVVTVLLEYFMTDCSIRASRSCIMFFFWGGGGIGGGKGGLGAEVSLDLLRGGLAPLRKISHEIILLGVGLKTVIKIKIL